jgi:predicted dehydrogenase
MSTRLTRRKFLQSTAAGAAGYWLTANALSAVRAADAPNSKLRFACIGVGGKGGGDTDHVGELGQVVALCDIDEFTLGNKADKFKDAKKFYDFRKLFDEMAKEIDAVTVSTPDHNHAPASIMAMKLGKHVYCQKPLTHTVYESRQMREVAKKAGVCTQLGNQGSAEDGVRRAVELVQAGILGSVREAHVWTNRPIWPQAPGTMKRPPESPVPASVHWDEWLGPAPYRPYSGPSEPTQARGRGGRGGDRPKTPRGAYHDFAWRGWWDFGTGALGDMACHTANMAYRALNLGFPTSIVADATDLNPETYPSSAHVTYEFPARGEMPALVLQWYEGKRGGKKLLPPQELLSKVLKSGQKLADSGSMLVGDKGILFSPDDYGAKYVLVGEGLDDSAKLVSKRLPRNGGGDSGMKREWVEAIKTGKPDHAYSNFDFAGMLTEMILLGNVAIRLNGQKLVWDGPSFQFANNSAANGFLHYEYRKGWTL